MEAIFAGTFALVIGVVGLWTGFKQLRNRRLLDRWPTTSGRVIERGIFEPQVPAGTPAYRYAPLIRYRYEVDGRELTNNYIHPKRIQLPRHSTRAWAQKRADEIPDEVVVHYNPDDPSESFLFQTPKKILYTVVVASILITLFAGIVFAGYLLKQ